MEVSDLLGKRIYLDANSLIYALESPAAYPGLVNLFSWLETGEASFTTSTIVFTEILVPPLRLRNRILEERYRKLLTPSDTLSIVPVETPLATRAAQLRADFGFHTPDAIHIATGLIAGCDLFLTNDLAWAKAGIPVVTPF